MHRYPARANDTGPPVPRLLRGLTTWVVGPVPCGASQVQFNLLNHSTSEDQMQFTYKLERAQKELGEAARKHFGTAELTAELPDATDNEQATIAALIESAGSVANLRNTYVSAARLARQKAVKLAADDVAARVESGAITAEQGLQELTDVLNAPAAVTIKGEGTSTRKPSGKTKEAAKREVQAEMQNDAVAALANLSGAQLKGAVALLESMGVPVPNEYKK
jgi:hypothetical protein